MRATFMPRPPPPAAALTSTGKPISLAILSALRLVGDGAVRARHDRDAEALGRRLGLDLVAHDADVLGGRTDEGDAVLLQDLGEARVLRQEAVARMDGVGAGDLAGGEQARDVEIALGRRRRADAHALVGEAHVHGIGIGRGVHGDGGDADLLAGALDPERDLAAVGDQHLVEHRLPPASVVTATR